jgi:UPF0755 protein
VTDHPGAQPRQRLADPPPRERPHRGTLLRRWVLLATALLVAAFLWALWQPFAGDGGDPVSVAIPSGASLAEIADQLDRSGVVSSGLLFEIRARLAGKSASIESGRYSLRRGMSYGAALDALTGSATPATLTVTVPEGLSREEIAPLAKRAGIKGSYIAASRESRVLDPRDFGAKAPQSLEGFLFPATYELKPGSTAHALVGRQLRAFRRQMRGISMRYAHSKNLNIFDVLTIASMVEREVRVSRERRLVAAVIYNRLKAHEPLGIDASVRYAVGNWTKPLTSAQLAVRSPYNTRNRAGLPPGPIGNPGRASIEAAANPRRVGYLYFVVKPGSCGEHVFARTQAAFERARQRYNRARRAAGGKSPTRCN